MPKGLVVTALSNQIEWATYKEDSSGLLLITGKREDVTNQAIKAMFQHMQGKYREHEETAKEKGYFSYGIKGVGELRFIPESGSDD